jgi:hypothetical protein
MRWASARARSTRRSPEEIKREGWQEMGVLVVSTEDERLTWLERELVRQLGSRLYGRTPREGR